MPVEYPRVSKIDIEFIDGSHIIVKGAVAVAGMPMILTLDSLFTTLRCPGRLLCRFDVDPIGRTIKPVVEFAQ